jgi:hypothetical protein
MTRRTYSYLLIFSIVLLIDCRQTKLFKKIEVTGRLVNYFSKEPVANAIVHLLADDVHSGKSSAYAAIALASATTDENGLFVIKCKQSKKTEYYIKISDEDPTNYTQYDTSFKTTDSKIDLGNINCRNHNINFKVHLIPSSGNCAWVQTSNFNSLSKISSSTDTTIFLNVNWYYSLVKEMNWVRPYYVRTENCVNQATISVMSYSIPITIVDTIKYQINF